FAMALYRPSLECEVLFGDLRSSIENSLAMTTSVNFTEPPIDFSVHLAEYEGSEHTSQYNQRGWREEDCEDSDNDDGTNDQQYFENQFFKEQCLADQA
ncbi:hypothetical protein PtrEW4_012289, partial [Pyrenophora tritici-repentis]